MGCQILDGWGRKQRKQRVVGTRARRYIRRLLVSERYCGQSQSRVSEGQIAYSREVRDVS